MGLIDDPENLRARAADMRGRADKAQFSETKQGLLRIADDYDVLAKRAEQRNAWLAKGQGQRVDAAEQSIVRVPTEDTSPPEAMAMSAGDRIS